MRILTTVALKVACAGAARAGFDRLLEPRLARKLDPAGRHGLVQIGLVHDDRAVRCKVLLKLKKQRLPHTAVIDVPLADFNAARDVPEGTPPE